MEKEMVSSRFYIDESCTEHTCCWDSAVVCEVEDGKGQYLGKVKLILECRKEDAEFICNALNAAREVSS